MNYELLALIIVIALLFINNLTYLIKFTVIIYLIYALGQLRHKYAYLPLYLITVIQGKKFKIATDSKEILNTLKLTDKGRSIEELFSCNAFLPILSLESVNGPIWEELKHNFMIFKQFLPGSEILSKIALEESFDLINENKVIDSKQISISTIKIFLKWIFCQEHLSLKENGNDQTTDFTFINNKLNDDILNSLYLASLEFRKEIAIKGKGDYRLKVESVDIIVKLLNESKYNKVFDWKKPIHYSVVMQPFVISPMINMSDIAVSVKEFESDYNKFQDNLSYIETCLFKSHPFPILERFDKESNTQIFIDMRTLENATDIKDNKINFGYGIRSCLGRIYARDFLNSFFNTKLRTYEKFLPKLNHLYSGRDNDNINFKETVYQLTILIKILVNLVLEKL
jgi:hypothetical protein